MTMRHAERQAGYRHHTRRHPENYTAWLNTEILTDARMTPKRLS